MVSVLGEESAELLIKTIDQTPVLEHAIVPRTILAWLQSASLFEGEVSDGVEMEFEKSESGFTGSIGFGGESYDFEGASVFHVAASVAVALGIEELESDGLRTLDIERIGKTIDLMSKAHRVTVELAKTDEDDDKLSDEEFERKYDAERLKARKARKDEMEMGEPAPKDLDKALGDSAPPPAPTAPKPQKAGAPKSSNTGAPKMTVPKSTSSSTMSLTRSEAGSPCLACGGRQFHEDRFVGCVCLESFAKSIKVTSATDAGLVLELDRRTLDNDDLALLQEVLGKC
jgi:hypothetical protein